MQFNFHGKISIYKIEMKYTQRNIKRRKLMTKLTILLQKPEDNKQYYTKHNIEKLRSQRLEPHQKPEVILISLVG